MKVCARRKSHGVSPTLPRVAASGLAIACVMFVSGGSAHAATFTGCEGRATSADKRGRPVDQATAPGTGGTRGDPFRVRSDGRISYSGATQDVLTNGRWKVELGVPFAPDLTGRVGNAIGNRAWSGEEAVSDRIPLRIRGLFRVRFEVTGTGAAPCTGSVWVRVEGNPITTPLGMAAVALTLAGLWGGVRDASQALSRSTRPKPDNNSKGSAP